MGELLMDETTIRPAAFDDFFRGEFVALVALATAITGSRSDGEDIAQVALTKAHRQWDRVSLYDKPGAWVRRVAINLAISSKRRASVAVRAVPRLVDASRESTAERAERADPDPELWSAVAGLPTQQRAAIALYYLEDRPVDEIAELLGCSPATARVHLHRGRTAIARALGVQP